MDILDKVDNLLNERFNHLKSEADLRNKIHDALGLDTDSTNESFDEINEIIVDHFKDTKANIGSYRGVAAEIVEDVFSNLNIIITNIIIQDIKESLKKEL